MQWRFKQESRPGSPDYSAAAPVAEKVRCLTAFFPSRNAAPPAGWTIASPNSGDGPAVFIMLIVGFIVTGGALIVEALYSPPYWLHAVLWIPLAIALPLLILRPFKATMIALQYANKAQEGQFR